MSIDHERSRMHGRSDNDAIQILVKENERLVERNSKLVEDREKLERELLRQVRKNKKPNLAIGVFINHQLYIMADISLTLAGPNNNGIFVLTDNKTGAVIPNPVFTNQAVGANSNPAAATFALDANNNVVPTALAVGSGTVVFNTHAQYNDLGDNSAQENDFSVTKAFTVKTSPDGASLDVQFS